MKPAHTAQEAIEAAADVALKEAGNTLFGRTLYTSIRATPVEEDNHKAKADKLAEKSTAVVNRWDSLDWKDAKHTADYINELRAALAEYRADSDQPNEATHRQRGGYTGGV